MQSTCPVLKTSKITWNILMLQMFSAMKKNELVGLAFSCSRQEGMITLDDAG